MFSPGPTDNSGQQETQVKGRSGEFGAGSNTSPKNPEEAYEAAAKAGLDLRAQVNNFTSLVGNNIKDILGLDSQLERLIYLDEQSAKVNQALGLGAQKAGEFRQLVADAGAKYAEIGLKMNQVADDYMNISKLYGTNISITDSQLFDLAATTKVTGVEIGKLAGAFQGVGGNLRSIPSEMMKVVKVAKEAGVIVKDVTAKVAENMKEMNMYNFQGGITGLAKMAAQSTKLGFDMKGVFQLAETVFNPEGAIKTAAALQRLGVSTTALLDPLKLMDLSANDPTELQNQIVNMTKDFVQFNKQLGSFEIMPGEKRRLREISKELNISVEELTKMGTAAAKLDYNMKQIKFRSDMSKEDRELVATLATINPQSGKAEVQIKRMTKDEEGNKVWTGKMDTVEAGNMTKDQLEQLREEQKLEGATMEEIAKKQLGELERLNAAFDATKKATAYSITTANPSQDMYRAMTTGARETIFQDKDNPNKEAIIPEEFRRTENQREMWNALSEKLKSEGKDLIDKLSNVNDLNDVLGLFTDVGSGILDYFKNSGMTNDLEKMKSYFTGGASPSSTPNPSSSNVSNSSVSTNNNVSTNNSTNSNANTNINNNANNTSSNINLSNKVDLNVTMDPAIRNEALTTLMSDAIRKYYEDPSKMSEFIKKINDIQTNNNLIPAWYKP
jgi:hypothetical protein